MSTWLSRAQAEIKTQDPVPKQPKAPKLCDPEFSEPSNRSFGSFDSFGTASPLPIGTDERPAGMSGFALLSPDREPCPGFRRWPKVHAAARYFLDVHAEPAKAFGWSDLELFGVHPIVGATRVDYCGVLMLGHDRVVAVSADAIGFANGLVARRHAVPTDAVLVWDFGRLGHLGCPR